MKSANRAVGLSLLVAAAASLAVMGWLSWQESAPLAPSQQSEVLLGRIAARSEVIDRLRAGELTLVEAAAKVRDLNASPDSDAEELCRQVIRFATAQDTAAGSGDEAKALGQRLQDELSEHISRHQGSVVLPRG